MPRAPRSVAVAMLGLALVVAACGDPAPTRLPPEERLPEPAPPLAVEDVARFSGVVTMNAGSNCTGTLIDTGVATGPAYVLTNGHCVGDVGRARQQVTVGLEWFGTAELFRAEGNLDATHLVDVVGLEYSTMRHTDLAIVRLDATLGELVDLGARPIRIADAEPAAGSPVVNIGVPVAGLDPDEWVMRRGDCTLGEQHTVIEFGWLWFGAWANDCPGIIQGSSGSPLLAVDDADAPTKIVGMINTTSFGVTAADGGACFINRPCQVTADGVAMVEDTSYAQSVAGVGRCFDATTGGFALGGDCPLETSSVWASQGGGAFRGEGLPDATGTLPEALLVGATEGVVRTALVPLGDATACTQAATYAGASEQPLPEAGEAWDLVGTRVPVDLPAEEGQYALCAVAGEDYAGAATVLFEVDRTPPLFPASASVEDIGGGAVIVRPHLDPPELSTVRFTWGPRGEVDCSDTASFQDFFIIPLTLEAGDLPATYCIYGLDGAGNTTPVTEIDIPKP